jgi:hypothetical protein
VGETQRASQRPGFLGDPYARYGGRSLHARSHGEAFLAVMLNRMESGMADLIARGTAQFIVATHSPGDLCALSPWKRPRITVTRGILEAPELYWRRLLNDETSSDLSG